MGVVTRWPTQATTTVLATHEPPATAPRWLVEWRPEEPLVASATDCAAALAAAEAAFRPADPDFIIAALEHVFRLFEEKQPPNFEMEYYLISLTDVPADLVLAACRHVIKSFRFGFPKPADFRSPILADLHERRRLRAKARLATVKRRDPRPECGPPSEEEKQQVRELLARNGITEAVTRRRRPAELRPLGNAALAAVAAAAATFQFPSEDDPAVQRMLREMGVHEDATSVPLPTPEEEVKNECDQ